LHYINSIHQEPGRGFSLHLLKVTSR